MTRALAPEVIDAIWAAVEPLLPAPDNADPLGCHNPRGPDRVCFGGSLIWLVTGSSQEDIEAIMDFVASETTLRTRRNEWIDAGVFDRLAAEALDDYDRTLGPRSRTRRDRWVDPQGTLWRRRDREKPC